MKKILAILVVLILVFGGYFAWNSVHEITPGNISYIVISDTETGFAQTYYSDKLNTEALVADLHGQAIQALPEGDFRAYSLKVKNSWGIDKNYELYFDKSEKRVFVKDLNTGRLFVENNPVFFSSHEGFDSLYHYRTAPRIEWVSSLEGFNVKDEVIKWQFRKWDGNWYDSWNGNQHETSGGDPHEKGTAETGPSPETPGLSAITVTSTKSEIRFNSSYPPDSAFLEVSRENGDTLLKQELPGNTIPIIDKEGTYAYYLELKWKGVANPYRGDYSCRFILHVDFPPVLKILNNQVRQGEAIEIRTFYVNEDEKPVLKQPLFKKFRFFRDGSDYVGYIPTSYHTPPGKYKIEFGVEGGEFSSGIVTVLARDFHIQRLYIDERIETSTRNEEAYAEYDKYFVPVRQSSNDEAYYKDPFVIPAKGRLSTEYGETRHVNDSPTSYRHSGLDIAAPLGEPVYAVNTGKVVLSRFLILTGNTIVIDHGLGLFSVYFHLDKSLVQQGDMVSRGQQIGKIGTTGFSTGPHLHFTMSFYDTNIEPGYFIAGEPITYANYKKYLE